MTEHRHTLGMLTLLISSPPDKRTVFGRALIQLINDVEERDVHLIASELLAMPRRSCAPIRRFNACCSVGRWMTAKTTRNASSC